MLTDQQLEKLRRLMKNIDDAQNNLTTAKAELQVYVRSLGAGDVLPVTEVAARAQSALGAGTKEEEETVHVYSIDNTLAFIAEHPHTTRAVLRETFQSDNVYYAVKKLIERGKVRETPTGKLVAIPDA